MTYHNGLRPIRPHKDITTRAVADKFPSELLNIGGLLGDMVKLIVNTSISPQPTLALAASLCSVGAVAGRKYRTASNLRTNLYGIGIADSGGGKDQARKIAKLALSKAGFANYLGGEEIASGPGLLTSLKRHPCQLFLLDEIGKFLKVVNNPRAPAHKVEIWTNLTKLYTSADSVYLGTEYANQDERPRIDIQQPCCSVYGVTVPGPFWSALESGALTDGSIARFLIFCVDDDYPDRNKRPGKATIPAEIIEALQAVAAGVAGETGNLAMLATSEPEPYTVPQTPEADTLLDRLMDEQTEWLRSRRGTGDTAIIARYYEHVAKVALIRSISDNPPAPVITGAIVTWATSLVRWCMGNLLRDAGRFVADNETEANHKRVRAIIAAAGAAGITKNGVTNRTERLKSREREEILAALVEGGSVVMVEEKTTGRPLRRYTIAAGAEG